MKKLNNNNGEGDDDDIDHHSCGCCAVADRQQSANADADDAAIDAESLVGLQTILRADEHDDTIVLDSIVCEPGSRPGDNYMSVVKRVLVRGQRAAIDSRGYARTLIVKRPILRLSRRQLFRCDEAFANEISGFRHLVPELRAFSDRGEHSVLPFPRCLFAGSDADGDLIVLDDLRESGYGMVDRLKGLDFAHSRLVMQVGVNRSRCVTIIVPRVTEVQVPCLVGSSASKRYIE